MSLLRADALRSGAKLLQTLCIVLHNVKISVEMLFSSATTYVLQFYALLHLKRIYYLSDIDDMK